MKKYIIVAVLVFSVIFLLVACGSNDKSIETSTNKVNDTDHGESSEIYANEEMDGNYRGLAKPVVSEGITTWDCVYFGSYKQGSDGGIEPIKWRVLGVKGSNALLLSDKNLDSGVEYNEKLEAVSWDKCTLRSWLNGYDSKANKDGIDYTNDNFINAAFTESEKDAIVKKIQINPDNPRYGTKGCNNTSDKVFLLTYQDVTNADYGFVEGFESNGTRVSVDTGYVYEQSGGLEDGKDKWWLRSVGDKPNSASIVDEDGWVGETEVDWEEWCVRPAIYLDLSSGLWKDAGIVSSSNNLL